MLYMCMYTNVGAYHSLCVEVRELHLLFWPSALFEITHTLSLSLSCSLLNTLG